MMILFLLKNRRLLFVALLLVLGVIPERSEGFRCYDCEPGEENKDDCNAKTTCAHPSGLYVSNWACQTFEQQGKVILKGCATEAFAYCFDKVYAKGKPCGSLPTSELRDNVTSNGFTAKIFKCFEKLGRSSGSEMQPIKGRNYGDDAGTSVICVCEGELCNTSQHQQTPNRKLIIPILIAAGFYNYI